MFTQIQTELELLVVAIEKIIDYITALRSSEANPNLYTEYGGRLIGLTEALKEIKKTKINVNEHIIDILKNTTDGNYVAKLGILEDENRVLRDKVYILNEDLKKYNNLKKGKKQNKSLDCLKELSESEIDKKIEDKYLENDEYEIMEIDEEE